MFLVCGEALMDVFAVADTATGMTLDARVGGSPFNVAIGLARLGQPVSFLAAVSRGFLGERLLRALEAEGVDTAAVERVDAPTTLGLVGLDERGVPSYAFYGEGGADRLLSTASLQSLQSLPASPGAIHVGSFATVVAPAAATLRALVERERSTALICYDPNVRLNVEPDRERWCDALAWMLPRTQVLKVSDEDLAALRPGIGVDAFLDEALGHGVGLCVVTRGEAGARAATRSARVEVAGAAVAVADTVGAGDTFQAALLTWLAESGRLSAMAVADIDGAGLDEALRFAVAAAAITCSRRGADLPRRSELGPGPPSRR